MVYFIIFKKIKLNLLFYTNLVAYSFLFVSVTAFSIRPSPSHIPESTCEVGLQRCLRDEWIRIVMS